MYIKRSLFFYAVYITPAVRSVRREPTVREIAPLSLRQIIANELNHYNLYRPIENHEYYTDDIIHILCNIIRIIEGQVYSFGNWLILITEWCYNKIQTIAKPVYNLYYYIIPRYKTSALGVIRSHYNTAKYARTRSYTWKSTSCPEHGHAYNNT